MVIDEDYIIVNLFIAKKRLELGGQLPSTLIYGEGYKLITVDDVCILLPFPKFSRISVDLFI